MGKLKNTIFYILTIGGLSVLIYRMVTMGEKLEGGRQVVKPDSFKGQWGEFMDTLSHNLQHPLALLLAQIITIILAAKLFGWICRKIGQPTVVGEMIAGILLGPSLLGLYLPEFSNVLFPKQSLGNLQFLSQIGLILFMFIVGMELDLKMLRKQTHDAVVISHASIIVPFASGIGLAYFIYESFAPEGVQFLSFGLFMGIAMSITAFPVLARIVQERGITKTRLGAIVITCAAADDITAWCILAAVIAIVKAGSFTSSLYIMALALVYVIVMIKMVRPFLSRIGSICTSKQTLTKPIVTIFFLTLIVSAYAAEVIGIHALFGAFMAGAIMPDNIRFRNLFIGKIEDIALIILLPLFFVFTGLRTQIGLLSDPALWKLTAMIIVIAVAGKFLGSALAAKFVGQSWKDSLSIGALMNTRGLMELVVLNIGYDLGVLTPQVFSMMVLMALITTFMTGPALDLINWAFRSRPQVSGQELKDMSKYKILLSFDKPWSGVNLLKLANAFTNKMNGNASLTAAHFSPANKLHFYDVEEYEKEMFRPVMEESVIMNRKLETVFKESADLDNEVTVAANRGNYDLLLISLQESIYEGSLLGRLLGFTTRIINPEKLLNTVTGKENIFDTSPFDEHTRQILSKLQVPVGILVDKGFSDPDQVFIPVLEEQDVFLIDYAQKLIHNTGAQVTIADASGVLKVNDTARERIRSIEQKAPNHIALNSTAVITSESLKGRNLMLISLNSWKTLIESKSSWLSDIPSTLVIADKPG
ncbi:cation:proton antiporter [Niabella yanshanensis]|uniref:Cation:proton antiporter n=1 Tax=Niabella yanshanensis TaxID=577386 RepID=A0ABZ0W9N5_9BACT|nr:cation:proton antiporter [Niabella yanshanensis]WQD39993.1 cation:proton antiporter [Niabella yanshanensis]